MSRQSSSRAAVPNGNEIKRLRQLQSKTQQELVGVGLTARTLQRAEAGTRVAPTALQAIATRLAVPFEQIIVKETPNAKTTEPEEAQHLSLARVRGRQLLDWLQDRPQQIEYNFGIDPDAQRAEHIAQFIEFCEKHHLKDFSTSALKAADRIRAIGHLNDQIDFLQHVEIGVFAQQHYDYVAESRRIEGNEDDSDKAVWFYVPEIRSRLFIDFGPSSEPSLKRLLSDWSTRKSVFEKCARINLKRAIAPEAVEKQQPFVDDEFVEYYRECWTAAQSSADQKVIASQPE